MCAAPLPGKAVSPSAMAFKTSAGQDRGCRVRTVSGSAALAKLAAEVAGLRRRSSSRPAPFRPSAHGLPLARQGDAHEMSRQHPSILALSHGRILSSSAASRDPVPSSGSKSSMALPKHGYRRPRLPGAPPDPAPRHPAWRNELAPSCWTFVCREFRHFACH